ncbi:amidohydrolase family protein [Paraconexibacter antarcticus]|uniref:Amidohydrolase family protein n=1 Tax=Paraconexibacter antarcticus TaxID=2949664 RepID=A0ABY5DMN3_9ACTN|nr:amidohydrolase family protein [Paraconexibacter antarcticus]UTI62861.1 amidohydrolase family protein [Paraconexibacter antarcticus]
MPVNGLDHALALAPILREPAAGLEFLDAHLHIGQNDPDGVKGTLEEILGGLDAAGHAGGLVYPMHEPDGYPPANDMIAAAVAASGGRLDWLCRVDPNAPGAVDEARRCLGLGAAGIKLHPRSDAFGLPHPVVDELAALAGSVGAPVLFHAGRGIPNLGLAAAELARRHPDVRIILAHAGISDLGLLAGPAAELPNLLFDTSWWNAADLLALLTTIPPGQILYASDMPYGTGLYAAFALTRCARQAGIAPDALADMAGAQLRRVIAREPLVDHGPAVGPGSLGPRVPALERVQSYTASALQVSFGYADPTEALSLARLGCQHGPDAEHGELLDIADRLLELASEHRAAATEETLRWAIFSTAATAHILCATPAAGVPTATV